MATFVQSVCTIAVCWLLLRRGAVAEFCPDVCRCFYNLDGETVTADCRGQDLTTVPSPLPNATSHL